MFTYVIMLKAKLFLKELDLGFFATVKTKQLCSAWFVFLGFFPPSPYTYFPRTVIWLYQYSHFNYNPDSLFAKRFVYPFQDGMVIPAPTFLSYLSHTMAHWPDWPSSKGPPVHLAWINSIMLSAPIVANGTDSAFHVLAAEPAHTALAPVAMPVRETNPWAQALDAVNKGVAARHSGKVATDGGEDSGISEVTLVQKSAIYLSGNQGEVLLGKVCSLLEINY